MRKVIYLVSVTFLAAGGCKEGEKKLFIDQVYNFKTVSSGDTVKAVFTVKNTMDKAVIIEDISSECDCIAPEKKTFTIGPGLNDELSVLFLTAGQTGPQEREVLVRTNAASRFYKLKIKGEVRK